MNNVLHCNAVESLVSIKRFTWVMPFLYTLAFLLYTYQLVVHMVSLVQLVRLVAILWFSLVLLYYPAYLVVRTWDWAPLLLTILVCGFYVSQSFFRLAGAIVLMTTTLYIIYITLQGRMIQVSHISFLLNAIALSMIIFASYLDFRLLAHVPWRIYQKSIYQTNNYSIKIPPGSTPRPDIYYIVLDGYLRSDMLQKLYGYDNTSFVSYLEERGFIIPGNIHSNYGRTALSIPSALNMDYVESIAPGLEHSYIWWLMEAFIDHNRVRSALESQGYRTVAIGSGWSMTDIRSSDIHLDPYPVMLTDLEKYYLTHTPLGYFMPAIRNLTSLPTDDSHRRTVMYAFGALAESPEIAGPKFVFAHIISPHPPFVFDSNGNPINPQRPYTINDGSDFSGTDTEYRKGYKDQVEFVNSQMKLVIDSIFAKSTTPPIIIIQSDHGSGLYTEYLSTEETCVQERFSAFGAYYLPGTSPSAIPPDLTPVNLFRIIFNEYFQTQMPMLENRQYNSTGGYLYNMVDITARVDEACNIH